LLLDNTWMFFKGFWRDWHVNTMIIFSTYQVELTGEDEAKEDSDGELRVESKTISTLWSFFHN